MESAYTMPLEIDDLDIALAKELEIDARQSNPRLASKLGTSLSTVRRKLKRLVDEGAITFVTIPHSAILDSMTVAFFGIQAKPGRADAVLHELQPLRSVQYSGLYMGRYDVLVMGIFRDGQKLIDFIDEDLATVADIVSAEMMVCVKNVKASWRYLGGSSDVLAEPPERKLDEHEIKLVKRLEINPRESITQMSEHVGLNRVLVGRKLQNLLNDRLVSVVGIIDPTTFGLHTLILILLEVTPGKVGAVSHALALYSNVHHVTIISGRFNIACWAVFQDTKELYMFLRDDLGQIPGVIYYETMSQMRLPKLALHFSR